MIRAAGHSVDYQSSKEKKGNRALKETSDIIAIAGGDGTVGKVARRVIGSRVPLAVLPLGTANNVANTLGLTGKPLKDIIAGWEGARCLNFDAGMAKGPWGPRYFIESVGLGLFAETMAEIKEGEMPAPSAAGDGEEKIDSVLRILAERLPKYRSKQLTVRLDGKELSGEYVLLEALNIRYVGPSLDLAASAKISDGLLDVIFVRESERDELKKYLSDTRKSKQSRVTLPRRRGRHLQVEWPSSPIHIDDKHWPNATDQCPIRFNAIDVKLDSGALVFLVPNAGKPRQRYRK